MEKIGLIPCAGKGTRLSLPFSKELFPNVHSSSYKPILETTIHAMKLAGIKNIIVTINPNKMDIVKYLGNGHQFDITISYCVHPEPRSLPHSINEAYHLIKEKTVVFAMPDTVIHPEDFLQTLVNDHEKDTSTTVTLAGFKTNNPLKFGMVDFEKETGIVKSIEDKPSSTKLEVMWGAMVWNPECTEAIHHFINEYHQDCEPALTDAFETLIKNKKVKIHCFQDGIYRDLGTYDEIINWSKE